MRVDTRCLPEACHSHIGCICLIFLHCPLSNVSSNSLHEKMHCHIGCIRLTFLHCALSNVSSNRLHEKMHCHIGCICFTFLHCDISDIRINIYFLMSYGLNFWVRCASGNVSNVSSNRLHEKMQVTLVAFVTDHGTEKETTNIFVSANENGSSKKLCCSVFLQFGQMHLEIGTNTF